MKYLAVLVSLFAFNTIADAQYTAPTLSIKTTHDTWIEEKNPDTNHDGETGMNASLNNDGNSSMVYLKYNLQSIAEHDSFSLSFVGGITDYIGAHSDSKYFLASLYALNDTTWHEEELTWNNRPKAVGELLATTKMTEGALHYNFSSAAFTKYISEAKEKGLNLISFVIKGHEITPDTKIWISDRSWISPMINGFHKPSHSLALEIHPESGCYKTKELIVEMHCNKDAEIYYTTDGSIPTKNSKLYNEKITLVNNGEVNAVAISNNERSYFFKRIYALNDDIPSEVTLDLEKNKTISSGFWKATGFSPAEILLRPDMQQTCDFTGAIPHKGMIYVRPHYLLNLVGVEGIDTPNPVYNWTRLDSALDILVRNNLKLIFELMGAPSSSLDSFSSEFDKYYQAQIKTNETFFTNFTEREKVYAWKRLVRDLVLHLIERYGAAEVSSWFFETTNEPNLKSFWKHSLQEFFNYYDACSEALKEVDPGIRFGGPGTAGGIGTKYLEGLLAHCDTGINYFTGERGVRIDFISVHIKDSPEEMIRKELEVVAYIKKHHPGFLNIPFVNDESDPTVGWGKDLWWRPLPWYAAFVAQSIDFHQEVFVDSLGLKYAILSNDNAFMGGWYNRTQLARHVKEGNPSHFSMVKKPCFTVNTLLSLLGTSILEGEVPDHKREHLGMIPTTHTTGIIPILMYNKTHITIPNKQKDFKDSLNFACGDEIINLNIKNLAFKDYTLVEYRLDDVHGNPYNLWVEMGKPEHPTIDQLEKLRGVQEIALANKPRKIRVENGIFTTAIRMPASSVSLLMLLPDNLPAPGAPQKPEAYRYTGINGEPNIMLRWEDMSNYNIMTFEIWFSTNNKDFSKVNQVNFIDNGFLHVLEKDSKDCYYKIRSVDYQGRYSDFSTTIELAP
ncbi:MAG: GH39 family glycosyl hydrolase [Bacteroidota bacterium]